MGIGTKREGEIRDHNRSNSKTSHTPRQIYVTDQRRSKHELNFQWKGERHTKKKKKKKKRKQMDKEIGAMWVGAKS
jgi:hypothetical protein